MWQRGILYKWVSTLRIGLLSAHFACGDTVDGRGDLQNCRRVEMDEFRFIQLAAGDEPSPLLLHVRHCQ